MRLALVTIFALLVAACSNGGAGNTAPQASLGAQPVNYDSAVRAYVRASFIDPTSIRDAKISDPFLAHTYWSTVSLPSTEWAVCLLANGRNRFGGYTGRQYTLLRIQGGAVTAALNDTHYGTMAALGQAHQNCPGRRYRRFQM